MLQLLGKLVTRMENELRFPPADPLLVATRTAYDALRDLANEVHYLSCKTGIGNQPRK